MFHRELRADLGLNPSDLTPARRCSTWEVAEHCANHGCGFFSLTSVILLKSLTVIPSLFRQCNKELEIGQNAPFPDAFLKYYFLSVHKFLESGLFINSKM